MPRSRTAVLLAGCAAACLVVAACGGDSTAPSAANASPATTRDRTTGSSATPAAAPTQPGTTHVGASPEATVVDRYLGYWEARFRANSGTPDPDSEDLREYATGAQLEAVVVDTRRNRDEGLSLRRRPDAERVQRVSVVSIDGDNAVVQECFVDNGLVVRTATGDVVDDQVETHNVRGELRMVDGRWKVSKTQVVQRWEGVAGCALAS